MHKSIISQETRLLFLLVKLRCHDGLTRAVAAFFDQMIHWPSPCIIRPTGLNTLLLLNAVTDGEQVDVGI